MLSLRVPFGEKPDHVKCLKRFVYESFVPLGISKVNNQTTDPQRENFQFATPMSSTRYSATNQKTTPTPPSMGRSPLSTANLIKSRDIRNQLKEGGPNSRARALDARIKEQEVIFADISNNVHHGSKEDFIAGVAESVSKSKTNSSSNSSTGKWNGSLTVNDIIYLSRRAWDWKKNKSVYEMLTTEYAANEHHQSAMDIIKMQDHCSMTEIFRDLRRKLPGCFDSERKTEKLKAQFNKEFKAVLEPTETKTGFRINPD